VVPVAFNTGSAIDVSTFPKLRARFRVTEAGQPVNVTAQSVFMFENNVTFSPTVVVQESNGIHVVEWTCISGSASANFVVYHKGFTTNSFIPGSAPADKVGARLVVRDSMSRNIPGFLDYGVIPAGTSKLKKLKVVATEAPRIPGTTNERRVRLESITTLTNKFKITWKGSLGTAAPPVDILSPIEYRIDVECFPTNNEPLFDVLTITFEGGMHTDVMLFANPSTYPRRTILNVVSPNGGENITPCQKVRLEWKGMIPNFTAYVDYTLDNGKSWKFIDSTADSSYTWTVPKEYSDSARIRVSQKFQSTAPIWLYGEKSPATKLAYSADSKYLLIAYGNGSIIEWNIGTATQVQKYNVALGSLQITAMGYIGQTRNFVAIRSSGGRSASMLAFTNGTSTPTQTVVVPTDITVRDIGTDQQGQNLWILPQGSGRILRYDPVTLIERTPIELSAPAQTSTLNGNTLAAHLMDGTAVTYNAIDATEIRRSQTGIQSSFGPSTFRMGASLTGRLMALGGQSLQAFNAPREQRTFIYDMQTNSIVKVLYREGTDAVSLRFSPNDAFLASGYMGQPQFVAYDLVTAKTLPPSGFADGHENVMTDLAFGPDGSTLVSTSVDSIRNVLMRRVATPESDQSDNVFRIVPPQLDLKNVAFKSLLIGTTTDTILRASVCNVGPTPVVFETANLMFSKWLTLKTQIENDTLMPGQCMTLEFTVLPLDTGLLTDTLRFTSCSNRFSLPLEMFSIDRNISVMTLLEDFGDVCVGKSLTKQFVLVRNNDSIAVTINTVFMEFGLLAQFRVVSFSANVTIPPGGVLELPIEFAPRKLGFDTSNIIIRYADQSVIKRVVRVTGRGSGADITLSHRALPFIPEIPIRELVIRNNSENPITVDSASITDLEPFTILTNIPVTIGPLDSLRVRIQYNGGPVGQGARLSLKISPCAAATEILLARYSGSATVSLPSVTADPRSDTTSIPINASISENVAYDGERFFEGAFTVNSRLFFAHSVTSEIGTGEIISQNVSNGQRLVRYKITGRFRGKMEIGRVIGSAGLADTDFSPLLSDTNQLSFGVTVTTTQANGELRIILPDPNRKIIDKAAPIIASISPNPTWGDANVNVRWNQNGTATVRIILPSGSDAITPINVQIQNGDTSFVLPTATLPNGMYYVVVNVGGFLVQSTFAVVH